MQRALALALTLGVGSLPCWAQSLAEIAEREKERRKAAEGKGSKARTLTNDDLARTKGQLANDPGPGSASPSPAPASAPPESGLTLYRRATPEPKEAPERARDEAYWRGLARQRRAQLQRCEQVVEYAEALAGAMAYGPPRLSDDGQTDWQAKRAQLMKDLETARQQLAQARQELAGLEDEARRAGALPAWLRE
jgi:hypothetical protein